MIEVSLKWQHFTSLKSSSSKPEVFSSVYVLKLYFKRNWQLQYPHHKRSLSSWRTSGQPRLDREGPAQRNLYEERDWVMVLVLQTKLKYTHREYGQSISYFCMYIVSYSATKYLKILRTEQKFTFWLITYILNLSLHLFISHCACLLNIFMVILLEQKKHYL